MPCLHTLHTCWPFLPMIMAVPVSWQPGRMRPAATLAFFNSSSATNLSFGVASLSCELPDTQTEDTHTFQMEKVNAGSL